MKCPQCGHFVEPSDLIRDDADDSFDPNDEELDPAPSMVINGQCDCMHDLEGKGQTERCERDASDGGAGMCLPCLFGCVD